jgi:hypothetical protein
MFGRRKRLPAHARPPLVPDERIVAWASIVDRSSVGGDRPQVVVATTLGLWLPGRAERLSWAGIHKATWSGSRLTITPAVPVGEAPAYAGMAGKAPAYAVMADGADIVADLEAPGSLPAEVRTRVTRSVALTEHLAVPGGGVRVVARRVPGVDGVTWHVRYDPGTDADDPDVAAATAEFVAAFAADFSTVR